MVSKKELRKRVDEFEVVPTRIYVKDFGPVAEADIELKPLTVLMGPNNTGKTYISTLLLIADKSFICLTSTLFFMNLLEMKQCIRFR
jgi:predicted ATP-binding protein involved in virulence